MEANQPQSDSAVARLRRGAPISPGEFCGAPLTAVDRAALHVWLEGFPDQVARRCQQLTASEPTWFVPAVDQLARFRMEPQRCLALVEQTVRYLAQTQPQVELVVWLLENNNNHGLDDFEAEAVFGNWLAIECAAQVERGAARSRLLIVGRLRRESMGLAFRLSLGSAISRFGSMLSLDLLYRARLPIAALFVDNAGARTLLNCPRGGIATGLRAILKADRGALALWVPRERTKAALADLRAEVAPLEALAGGKPVRQVRFELAEALQPPLRFAEQFARAGIVCDSSLVAPAPHSTLPTTTLRGSYLRAGAYRPQPFDLRTPSGGWDAEGLIELVSLRLESFGGSPRRLWRWRANYNPERLARLLNYRRMEKYFHDCPNSAIHAQKYADYRVFNWPPPEGTPRPTLIDAGGLENPLAICRLIASLKRLAGKLPVRWRLCSADELIEAARHEARGRLHASRSTILACQIEAHRYLRTIPLEAALREDLRELIALLPDRLGSTLELGSGCGQLGHVLRSRTSRYVGVDLNRSMFEGFEAPLRFYGVVADVHALPFVDASFDSVLANNVLEHVYDPVRCLREVHRVLKPGGQLYALIPLDALNSDYSLRAHLWKADEQNIREAVRLAGLEMRTFAVIDLYALGVAGAFPSCNGLVCKMAAARPEAASVAAA
jgi:SAM-dependent methyltransferase